ncbi:MAG TPA: Npt1/Npt2 family nucleotide transporter [Actinomycetota bacterium]|nr:Npt1/Npt2 family nucleotide transporter [Actinomycetota bacterium]
MAGEGRLASLIALRPGEGRPIGLAVAVSFFASAGLMIGQSGIEALFFARYGVSKLPVMYLVLGGTMLVLTVGFGALLGRLGRGRACLLIPIVLAAAAAAGRIALAGDIAWITQALWLLQGAAQFLVGLSVWGLAGLLTDTRQAKRFFPLIGAGSVLGYVIGGLVTKPLASWVGTSNLLLVWIVTLAAVMVLGARLLAIGEGARGGAHVGRHSDHGPIEQLLGGLHYVRRSSLMRWLASSSILFSLLFFSLYLPFSRAATARYPDPDELAGFFGVFFGLSTGVAFLLSLFVTNRLLARFGVPTVLLVLPILYVAAFGVLSVESTFAILAVFRFTQVAWMSGGAVSSWEAVINTVPPDRRDQTRAFLYGGPTQVGTVLAGVVALIGGSLDPTTLSRIGLASALLATAAMIGVRRAYPIELVRALREGRPKVFDPDPVASEPFALHRSDRAAMTAAVEGLASADPRVRRVAAHVLGEMGPDAASEPLLAHLDDDDAEVRAAVVASLARAPTRISRAAIVERSRDREASVRRAVVEALARSPEDRASAAALAEALHDTDPSVRARAAAALAEGPHAPNALATLADLVAHPDALARTAALDAMRGLAGDGLFASAMAALTDPAPMVRAEAARTIASLDPARAVAALTPTLADEHRLVRTAVAEAFGMVGPPGTPAVVESLDSPTRWEGATAALQHVALDGHTDRVRRFASEMAAVAVESHRLALSVDLGAGDRSVLLRDSLLSRSEREATLALRAAAALGGASAMTEAIENLAVSDPAQRANAIEVIESVGARELVSPLLGIWEGTVPPIDARALRERLASDPDDWIRACVELLDAPRPDPEGGMMARTLPTLSPMERVLFLRKVALFAELPPQDLQPIAAIAEEHAFADGDTIAEQGDPGDAMHIIVSGDVSVVAHDGRDGPGDQRVVAVRSSGDVVGEMAVITNEPRIAGLVARGDVRVLSIARPQFESILRERPETALGVIRVLCQRLAEPPPSGGEGSAPSA